MVAIACRTLSPVQPSASPPSATTPPAGDARRPREPDRGPADDRRRRLGAPLALQRRPHGRVRRRALVLARRAPPRAGRARAAAPVRYGLAPRADRRLRVPRGSSVLEFDPFLRLRSSVVVAPTDGGAVVCGCVWFRLRSNTTVSRSLLAGGRAGRIALCRFVVVVAPSLLLPLRWLLLCDLCDNSRASTAGATRSRWPRRPRTSCRRCRPRTRASAPSLCPSTRRPTSSR